MFGVKALAQPVSDGATGRSGASNGVSGVR